MPPSIARTAVAKRTLLTLGGYLAICFPIYGATFHVSNQKGSDANAGTVERPWKTLGKAASSIQSGDVVLVHEGLYRADRFELGPAGQSPGVRTIFRAAAGERPLLTTPNGTPPGFSLADNVRAEGLWVGGRWTKDERQPLCALGGSPIGRGKQLVGCTIFGYTEGISVGSSEDLLVEGCRVVHCGKGRFRHGCYLSGGYTQGAMTQHVVLDDNIFVAGEGYAIHGWHNPHSCILTRNFVSGFYWDLVLNGSDHLVAQNTLWRNTGQPGREPGWNAWLPAQRVVFANNILASAIPILQSPGPESTVLRNAYLTAPPPPFDTSPIDLRKHDAALTMWIRRIDDAVAQIDKAFDEPVERILGSTSMEKAFAVLGEAPPASSGLLDPGLAIGLVAKEARASLGRSVPQPSDFWAAFKGLKLRHFDSSGQVQQDR